MTTEATPAREPTPKMLNFVKRLLNEREFTPTNGFTVEQIIEQADALTFDECKAWIDTLKKLPVRKNVSERKRQLRQAIVPFA
jgi:hypothetical protein